MDRYSARMNLHGKTTRERTANRLRDSIKDKAIWSLSYKDVKLNGKKTQLVIDSGTQPYYKDYKTLPGQEINIGDYVEWANSYWIVFTCDYDNEFYQDGKLYQCNYLLKWQNERGEIIERWAHIQSASKYNDGATGNKVLSIGSDQLSVIVPVDGETIKLKKSMGKKFFIDHNKTDPTAYELTGTGNVPDTYNSHGVTSWIVKECAYTPSKDDLKFGVCDYRNPYNHHSSKLDKKENLFSKIIGKPTMDFGFSRTYFVRFFGEDDCDLDYKDFRWNIVSDFEVKQTVNGKQIELLVDNEDYIGSSFLLQVVDSKGKVLSELRTLIVEGF